jgi:hypothetical protein
MEMTMRDSNGDAWTSSDTALYWVLGVMVALIIVGFIAVFGSPKSQQTAQQQLQNTETDGAGRSAR